MEIMINSPATDNSLPLLPSLSSLTARNQNLHNRNESLHNVPQLSSASLLPNGLDTNQVHGLPRLVPSQVPPIVPKLVDNAPSSSQAGAPQATPTLPPVSGPTGPPSRKSSLGSVNPGPGKVLLPPLPSVVSNNYALDNRISVSSSVFSGSRNPSHSSPKNSITEDVRPQIVSMRTNSSNILYSSRLSESRISVKEEPDKLETIESRSSLEDRSIDNAPSPRRVDHSVDVLPREKIDRRSHDYFSQPNHYYYMQQMGQGAVLQPPIQPNSHSQQLPPQMAQPQHLAQPPQHMPQVRQVTPSVSPNMIPGMNPMAAYLHQQQLMPMVPPYQWHSGPTSAPSVPMPGYSMPMMPMGPVPMGLGMPMWYDENHALLHKRRVIKRRTRTGCLTCRKRRIKCDERKPYCFNCERSRKVCLGYQDSSKKKQGEKDEKDDDEGDDERTGRLDESTNY